MSVRTVYDAAKSIVTPVKGEENGESVILRTSLGKIHKGKVYVGFIIHLFAELLGRTYYFPVAISPRRIRLGLGRFLCFDCFKNLTGTRK